jgi:hypothetical protein
LKIRSIALWTITAGAIAAMALFAAACGDDDSSSGQPGGGGSGSDASYVSSICKAELKLQKSLTSGDIDVSKVTDAKSAIAVYSKPLDQFVKDLKAANPPKDFKSYHDKMISNFEDITKKLKEDGDFNALSGADSLEDPPQDIADRLTNAAKDDKDCQAAGFDF